MVRGWCIGVGHRSEYQRSHRTRPAPCVVARVMNAYLNLSTVPTLSNRRLVGVSSTKRRSAQRGEREREREKERDGEHRFRLSGDARKWVPDARAATERLGCTLENSCLPGRDEKSSVDVAIPRASQRGYEGEDMMGEEKRCEKPGSRPSVHRVERVEASQRTVRIIQIGEGSGARRLQTCCSNSVNRSSPSTWTTACRCSCRR